MHSVGQPRDHLQHVVSPHRVQGACRLVEEQDVRLEHQRSGDAETQPHASREPPDAAASYAAQADGFQRLANRGGRQRRSLGEGSRQTEDLSRAEPRVESGRVRAVREPPEASSNEDLS